MSEYILEAEHITKDFPGIRALDDVCLKIKKGEVHAVVGENGAGKSTLMKVLVGIHTAEAGVTKYDGEPVRIKTPDLALKLGISMIHQEISLIPERTVAENIFIGREFGKLGIFVDWAKLFQSADALLNELDIDVSAKEYVKDLSVAQQQMVEIARAVSYQSSVIIMDEPTSSLTEIEVKKLFNIISALKKQNKSVVFISHRLEELLQIVDTFTVLRDGKFIGAYPRAEVDKDKLISLMVGRELSNIYPKEPCEKGDVVMSVRGLCRSGVFSDISFDLHKGEILGVYGLVGAGRSEIMNALFGIDRCDGGEIVLDGKRLRLRSTGQAISAGVALVPEDRKKQGLTLCRSVQENVTIDRISSLSRFGFVNRRKEKEEYQKIAKSINIKTPSGAVRVNSLSGGNQQKVVIAKWLIRNGVKVLIMDEPTRGVDVGAKFEIYKLIMNLVKSGMALVMVSSEMPEILGMCDRILVIKDGSVSAVFNIEEATQEKIAQACI